MKHSARFESVKRRHVLTLRRCLRPAGIFPLTTAEHCQCGGCPRQTIATELSRERYLSGPAEGGDVRTTRRPVLTAYH